MAPRCRLVSLKVLDDEGNGEVSNLIAAIAHIQEKNGHGRLNLIHGVNISLGYDSIPNGLRADKVLYVLKLIAWRDRASSWW